MKINGYDCCDKNCPQRKCWSPGLYQHRGACGAAGSRNTGAVTKCCMTRAYRGCPEPLPSVPEVAP